MTWRAPGKSTNYRPRLNVDLVPYPGRQSVLLSASLVFRSETQIIGVGSLLRSKRLGLQARNTLVFQDASRSIFRYYGKRKNEPVAYARCGKTRSSSRSGKRMDRTTHKEAKHVLPSSNPGGCAAHLEVAINIAEFAQYPVAVAAVLSGFSARSLAHLLFLLTEALNEQLVRENQGLGSLSVPARQFLQERRIAPQGAVTEASTREARAHERMTSAAAVNEPLHKESSRSPLDKRSEELERGAGGDHNLPYRFTLPTSTPQVLAWLTLQVRVQQGDLRREVVPLGSGNNSAGALLDPPHLLASSMTRSWHDGSE